LINRQEISALIDFFDTYRKEGTTAFKMEVI